MIETLIQMYDYFERTSMYYLNQWLNANEDVVNPAYHKFCQYDLLKRVVENKIQRCY